MRRAWLVNIVAIGCGPVVAVDDGSGSGDDTSTTMVSTTEPGTISTSVGPSTTSTTTVTSSPDTTDVDTGCGIDCVDLPPASCPAVPGWECSMPVDCGQGLNCGGVFSPFDGNGCLRANCNNAESCPPDEVCFTPDDWGQCASGGIFCSPGPTGECVCNATPDCGGSWCVPVDEVPPANCSEIASTDACAEAGCLTLEGRPILASGDSCLCELPILYCTWAADPPIGLEPTVYWRWEDQAVVVFQERYDPPPIGWSFCSDANSPEACACAEFLPCAM